MHQWLYNFVNIQFCYNNRVYIHGYCNFAFKFFFLSFSLVPPTLPPLFFFFISYLRMFQLPTLLALSFSHLIIFLQLPWSDITPPIAAHPCHNHGGFSLFLAAKPSPISPSLLFNFTLFLLFTPGLTTPEPKPLIACRCHL